jgi:hypothetical protein
MFKVDAKSHNHQVYIRLEAENPSPQDPILILYHYLSLHFPSGLFAMEL